MALFPPIEPFDAGMLDVGDGQSVHWARFAGAVPERLRDQRLVDAYATLLADPEPAVRAHAAREWCLWEEAHVSLAPGDQRRPRYRDPEFRYLFARLVTHYWRHSGFLEDGRLLRDVTALDGTPGALVHGRYDVSGPLETAWRLHRRWRTSELRVVEDAGHGGAGSFADAVAHSLLSVADRARPGSA